MAETMKLCRSILGLFTTLMAMSVVAEEILPDPTQPPAAVISAAQSSTGAAPTGPVLQSVILRRQGVPMAVISGEMVPLGGKVGDSTLVQVKEGEVVLKGALGREVLYLTPDVSKKFIVVPVHSAGRRKQ